jgi:hypothetical protein
LGNAITSVKYNNEENVGLIAAKYSEGEAFGVYGVLWWTAATPVPTTNNE